ncbi:TIM21-domain-containing protein [Crepidotus variabilis]|uniref:Mitochondrial import inner membrane translocase subunit Tim21 n=1 Tax=Crepidotus variabilis TaxID=179855 RepID=A0A9P6EV06_9AGAR|nr:TIM21-domain-containing protein [Crepidotus variabilis]
MDFGNTNSSLLKESRNPRNSEPKHDNVGPFQLGLSPSAMRQGEKVRKWSELSAGGKVMRTTARTTNLGVILLGAGLSALLIYSLTSELFSNNSPTVIYGDACDRIKHSELLARYLNGPLTFHNNPPSAIRPRHRNRHVTSRVMVDQNGQEHMIMTFYVQGRPDSESVSHSDLGYWDNFTVWVQDKTADISDISFDSTVDWSKATAKVIWDKSIRAFKYVSGDPLPLPTLPPMNTSEDKGDGKNKEGSAWSFAGMFSSLRGPTSASKEGGLILPGKNYTEGEVHADLVKNTDGYFVFRYLLVDIPNSRARNPIRIFVEREPGVRETEPVMRWISS